MEPPLALGIATLAIVAIFAGWFTFRRPLVVLTLEEKVRRFERDAGPGDGREDHWLVSAQNAYDQRKSLRRRGALTPILVSAPMEHPVQPIQGFVIDRSPEGLCLAVERAFEVGTSIHVNPIDSTGVTVTVRNCRRKQDDLFLIGCQFQATVPWDILLRFG